MLIIRELFGPSVNYTETENYTHHTYIWSTCKDKRNNNLYLSRFCVRSSTSMRFKGHFKARNPILPTSFFPFPGSSFASNAWRSERQAVISLGSYEEVGRAFALFICRLLYRSWSISWRPIIACCRVRISLPAFYTSQI
jgi:hypothetical protein